MEVLINEELKSLIPPLQQEERQLLEQSILEEGCRDAIIIWKNKGYIVDGHNRYDICTKHNKTYRTFEKDFTDFEAVKIWIKKNQISRRNLSPFLRAEYYIECKEWEWKREKARNNSLNNLKQFNTENKNSDVRIKEPDLQKQLANTLKISTDTASRIIQIKEKAPEPIKAKLRTGEYSINEVYTAIKTAERGNGHEPLTTEKLLPIIEKKNVHVSNNSGETEWYTPQEYINAARNAMGSIDIDPASSEIANKTVRATTYFTIQDNGLSKDWNGNVWMNPPYAQPTVTYFCDLLTAKYLSKEIKQACVLLNNATETKYIQNMLASCSAICFIEGRVKFIDKSGKAGSAPLQGQIILYFGINIDKFTDNFKEFGKILYAKN